MRATDWRLTEAEAWSAIAHAQRAEIIVDVIDQACACRRLPLHLIAGDSAEMLDHVAALRQVRRSDAPDTGYCQVNHGWCLAACQPKLTR